MTQQIARLVPETQSFARPNPGLSIARAAIATGMTRIDRSKSATEHALQLWPFDQTAAILTRAATAPLTLSGTGLVEVATAVLPALVPVSAAAKVFSAGLSLAWDGAGAIIIPNVAPPNTGVSAFVAEGMPKPVVMGATTGARLDPHKIAPIAVISSELFSQASIETIMQRMLAEVAAVSLDTALFSNAPADATRPAGLLNGITPITASTNADLTEAMTADIIALGSAIAPVAGGSNIVFVTNMGQALALQLRTYGSFGTYGEFGSAVFTSSVIPPGTVIAIAINALVSIFGVPSFETSTQATLHLEGTTPLQIGTPGSPPTVAAPTQSMFQSANIGIKLYQPVTWALRSPQAVAVVAGTKW
ncbi:MAG TPA: phage major capsid protein [Xanthobacteraceae bacterium]|jgi:hypothetical protein